MTSHTTVYKSLVLTIIVVLSVVAGTMGVAGMTTNAGPTHEQQTTNGALSAQIDANLQTGSAKALTISWFRDDGDSNGPYPVPPNEYDGQEAAGIGMFHNAEGDAQLRVDDSTALNPNGQWDMMALHVETDGLDALNPPSDGGDKGLVTQQFLQSDNWSVDITQTNGDKVLNVGDNQDGYENPPGVSADVPPVMVFADTDEVEGDYTVDGGPDTGLYVWIDPNRATLMKNGQEASFEPGDKFKATFHVGDQTDTTTFEMVQGDVTMPDDLSPGNTAQGTISGRSTLAAGTDVEVELSFANGDTMSHTVEVKGNKQIGGDTAATAPQGYVNATFDLTGRENQKFTVDAYAPGPDGGLIDGAPARNDDDYLSEKNRIHVATGSGTVKNVVNSNYTIDNATIYASKMLTIAYHNSAIDPAGLGTQIGDGDATGDFSLAKNTDGHGKFDEAWLLYETNDLSKAIQASPGSSQTEKFLNSPLSLEIKQTNAGGSPKMVNLSRNATGVSVFTDNGDSDPRAYNETDMVGVLFSLHPNQMQFYKDGEPVEPEIGDEYDATLTVDTEQGTQTDTIHFKIVDGKTVLANPPLKLPQSQNSKIQFNTTQSSGTAMSIHFEALADNGTVIKETTSGEIEADGHGPVIAGKHGASNPWGSFSTTVDTSDLPVGTKITAEARIAADVPSEDRPEGQSYVVVERANGTISAPPSADLSLSDQTGDGEKIVLDEVKLSDGGFVSLHLGSSTGKLLGTSGYLESGTKTDLTIELDSSLDGKSTVYAVAHQDTNGNQEFDFPTADGPYMSDGSATTASASYTLESQTPEPTTEPPTESTTEPMNGGTTNPAEETTTSGSGSGNGSGSGPGFTLVAALLSLLAVAAIVVRRR